MGEEDVPTPFASDDGDDDELGSNGADAWDMVRGN